MVLARRYILKVRLEEEEEEVLRLARVGDGLSGGVYAGA